MDETRRINALNLMVRTGGSFASTLAKAWLCADSGNAARLESAFGDLLEQYATAWDQMREAHQARRIGRFAL